MRRVAAFTLMETLAALTIGAIVAMSAIGAMQALTSLREKVDRRVERTTEARRALEAIVAELRNVRRDEAERDKPVIVGHADAGSGARINLLVTSDRRVRSEGQESDQYEVSFFLSSAGQGRSMPALMCRRDHALDERIEEGGIVQTVAENIAGLSFEYLAGGQWYREWTLLEPQPPEAVRISVMAASRADPRGGTPDTLLLSTVVPIHAAAQRTQNSQQGDKPQEQKGS